MSFMTSISRWFKGKHPAKRRPFAIRAGYSGARTGLLTADMVVNPTSADTDIRWSLKILRARCRDLAINNDYVKKFLWLVAVNVVGPKGIMMQSKMKLPDGTFDKENNRAIEQAFLSWGKKKNCTVTGMNSWPSLQRQIIQTVARDGEIFIRKLRGFPNDFGFALQAIEADYINESYNDNQKNIRMGIEYDSWRRPIAYHLLKSNPGDYQSTNTREHFRIPAGDMIHLFIQERPEQGRGVPWIATPMFRLNMLGGYEENELVSSRAAAGKMGFFTEEGGGEYTGEGEDAEGNTVTEINPGTFERLPAGVKFEGFDPQHPTTAYGQFIKSALRGISSGLLVSYNSLANDLEGVNYSSIRQGVIDERDIWRILQGWMIEHFHQEIYPEWKEMALLSARIKPSVFKNANELSLKWQPRGWAWVDPLKDLESSILGIKAGLQTRTSTVGESGEDLEEILAILAEEEKLIKEYGLTVSLDSANETKINPKEKEEDNNQNVGEGAYPMEQGDKSEKRKTLSMRLRFDGKEHLHSRS